MIKMTKQWSWSLEMWCLSILPVSWESTHRKSSLFLTYTDCAGTSLLLLVSPQVQVQPTPRQSPSCDTSSSPAFITPRLSHCSHHPSTAQKAGYRGVSSSDFGTSNSSPISVSQPGSSVHTLPALIVTSLPWDCLLTEQKLIEHRAGSHPPQVSSFWSFSIPLLVAKVVFTHTLLIAKILKCLPEERDDLPPGTPVEVHRCRRANVIF